MAENRTEQDDELIEIEEEIGDVEDTEDGGAIVSLEEEAEQQETLAHFANIVDEVDQLKLQRITLDLLRKIEIDKKSREKRDKLYEEGLRRTGMGDDAPGGAQFAGATKVVHPMMIEACVDFSARAMKELFPPSGPVKTKTYGKRDQKKLLKAQRKADFMNFQLTERVPQFRAELEQLTTQLPLGGGQYLKWMFDQKRRTPVAEFVPIDDILLPYAATNFYSAERKTHRQYLTEAEFEMRVSSGMYRDVNLTTPQDPEQTKAGEANDKIEGRAKSMYNEDGLRIVYEIYTWLDIEETGESLPYIISIDDADRTAVALYRNWDPEDEAKEELVWIVEFPMIPWRGAYPIGLTHMIGGLTTAATGALRALLDSAHIQNMPTALKLKGGPDGQQITLQPTQIAEIEGDTLVDDIRKLVMPLPFPGPSSTLYQLLGFLIDAGKGVVQTSFENLSDANAANMPVGTTLALIEQGMMVFSSIHSRLHSSMAMCLRVLHRINHSFLTDEDIEKLGDFEVRIEDFDQDNDVIPVSDPNIFSEAQRFAQVQAVVQRADLKPDMYDPRKVETMFLRQLKVDPDDVLGQGAEPENLDPASENIAMVMGSKVFVLPKQDHIGHLIAHIPFAMSPVFGASPAMLPMVAPAMVEHLRNHVLQYYVTEAHRAVADAIEEGILNEDDGKEQARLIAMVQEEVEPVMQQVMEFIMFLQQQIPPVQPGQMPPDPTLAVAQMTDAREREKMQANMQLEREKVQQKGQETMAKLQLEQQRAAQSAEQRMQDMGLKRDQMAQQAQLTQMQEQNENMRTAEEIASRERMNTSDNETAMLLAQAEIESGENIAVSTGTGINPNP